MSDCLIRIKLEHSKPVELGSLILFMQGIVDEYRDQALAEKAEADEARLYVQKISEGCIEIDLTAATIALLQFPHTAVLAVEVTKKFVENVSFALDLLKKGADIISLSTGTLRNMVRLLDLIAKDSQAKFTIFYAPNNSGNIRAEVNSLEANASQNRAEKELARRSLPSPSIHQSVILKLIQTGTDKKCTHKGIISSFHDQPRPIVFQNHSDKKMVLADQKNPFNFLYVVDAEALYIDGKIKSYKILKIYEKFEDDG